ncbi:unnamed protein product [Callosobruchus maculatus]|uniref:Elongation of very long chain fatty acids protein n=1 Tax=Callosobruchus maculatus TaxID=64391 RepID=A0A653CMT2_CALMS|nr:unnamed protein product [Callosobruchus maculatus]VEN54510.1 unnamed protein product [Callosobruchus maculatus]
MAVIVDLMRNVNNFMNKHQDPRTANWFLMSSPFYTLGICIAYVVFVKIIGPKLMENRKPFKLQQTLVYYNLFQVLFSTWLFYEIGMGGWFTGEYSFRCQPVDYSNKPSTLRMVRASWWYFFSKFTEFVDTIFFVLRKKNQQITTLHVIHHGVMPMSVWFGVKFTPGGHSTFFGFLNTFVHIIMYSYYMLSAMGPEIQKYLWWKKYITTLQMIQFVAIMVHAFQLLFTECNYPRAFVWWIGMHAVMFFFLFKEFYNEAYTKKKRAAAAAALKLAQNGNGVCQNGAAKLQNGVASSNGYAKTPQNGAAVTSVNDYYVNGVNQRIKGE